MGAIGFSGLENSEWIRIFQVFLFWKILTDLTSWKVQSRMNYWPLRKYGNCFWNEAFGSAHLH